MHQACIDFTPRELGHRMAELAKDAAERRGWDSEGAARFIASWVVRFGPTSGEDLVDAAKEHGFRPPKDDRAFGSIFTRLVREGKLVVIRSDLPRKRGHGTSGGRLYGAGELV